MSFLDRDPEMQEFLSVNDGKASSGAGAVLPVAGGGHGLVTGAYDAADRANREIALWTPPLHSADDDILPAKEILDVRSRDTVRNDGYISGASDIYKDSIVGALYALNSKPAHEVLGLDEVWAEEFQLEVETKFTLAAESSACWFDASRRNTVTELVRLGVGIGLMAGEVLGTMEWINTSGRPFKTAMQMIDVDRLSNPSNKLDSRELRGGVQMDRYGAPLGYHIRTTHPTEFYGLEREEWSYVPAYKPWGRPLVLHLFEQQRPGQTRGVSKLASTLKQSRSAGRFRDIMLENAVVNATFAASIESELPTEAVYQMMGGGNLDAADAQKAIQAYAQGYLSSINEYVGSRGHRIDGVKVPHLFPGTKLQLRPAGQGGPLGTELEQSMLRYIAASLGLSYEQFSHDYSKANY